MTITVATSKLIDTLTDALQTADDIVGGIHFATQRAPYKSEPGDTDLLVATSTDRYTIGHTWIPVDGDLIPTVWPVESAKTVLAICKSLGRKGDEHTVDIDATAAPPPEEPTEGEHPGWTVTLSETPALFDSDTEFQFHAHAETRFPTAMVHRALSGLLESKEPPEPSLLTQWGANVLAPLVAVAKRRKQPIRLFRQPLTEAHLVQIGDTWLGVAYPIKPLPGEASEEPSVEPILTPPAGAVDELREAIAEMKASGVTVTVDNPRGAVAQTIADAAAEVGAE
ncbi:DNA translocase FtsK [Mycolicibacterium pulveris]|uniref:Uncharacterized protein n=1 Tax=Mycolicibacterium pulveris TaxID=36813 RepID=A0A7I7URW6_MYCPV|nr:DNA translocase FtsK [Mycolicibacterium pulveris]MCV6982141.1 DNA translocase FtsK [Mycolicibacterium pulveris]BBY84214.1 hypothetical protein MPUL_53720 [Mycolicibacterium pulveris]